MKETGQGDDSYTEDMIQISISVKGATEKQKIYIFFEMM